MTAAILTVAAWLLLSVAFMAGLVVGYAREQRRVVSFDSHAESALRLVRSRGAV